MKIKNKTICAMVLIVILVLMMFAACGSSSNSNSSANTGSASGSNSSDTSAEETQDADEESMGHFNSADMKAIKEKLVKDYDEGLLRGRSYEDIRDSYFKGVEGHLYMDTSTISQYYWFVIGSKETQYVKVTFQDYGNGKKTAGGYGAYVP